MWLELWPGTPRLALSLVIPECLASGLHGGLTQLAHTPDARQPGACNIADLYAELHTRLPAYPPCDHRLRTFDSESSPQHHLPDCPLALPVFFACLYTPHFGAKMVLGHLTGHRRHSTSSGFTYSLVYRAAFVADHAGRQPANARASPGARSSTEETRERGDSVNDKDEEALDSEQGNGTSRKHHPKVFHWINSELTRAPHSALAHHLPTTARRRP